MGCSNHIHGPSLGIIPAGAGGALPSRALSFPFTTIAAIIAFAAFFVGHFFCIGWLLLPVVILVPLAGTIFAIIAGIKASNGEDYKYPWSLELVK